MPRTAIRAIAVSLAIAWSACLSTLVGKNCIAADIDFNRDVRPILSENCFHCHGQDPQTRAADLRLDIREDAIALGALVPGSAEESELLSRVLSDDPDLQMPPHGSNRHLTDTQKQLLKTWIESGAEYARHWAFAAPKRPTAPSVSNEAWVRNPIDQFLLAKMHEQGLSPSPEADRSALLKRLYIDLIGLPPTNEEMERFLRRDNPVDYETIVDELLGRQEYGERMAIPWLDAARYADSNGFQQDGDTWQWMWRDWVVSALNANLPFDQFATWQLAGDLLPNATTEQKIASGFNRNHLLNGEGGAIPEEQRFVILFDRIDTTSTVFLGLTMACAQCHDHKYDPITQQEYYQLMDAFNRVPETGTPQYFSSRIRVANPFIEVPTPEVERGLAHYDEKIDQLTKELSPLLDAAFAGWKQGLIVDGKIAESISVEETIRALLTKRSVNDPSSPFTPEDAVQLEQLLRNHFDQKVRGELKAHFPAIEQIEKTRSERQNYVNDQMPRPMVMSDDQPRDTHILLRGEYLNPGDKVAFDIPSFLPKLPEDAPKNRLGFAQWLFQPDQPLTARVHVNRMWQHFFSVGLVKTSEDFGVQSEFPLHLDLLDWLAVEFRESGWDMKHMHRLIVTSSAYRQTSRFTDSLREFDPENRYYARSNRFRMPAMILRDWALAASQTLNNQLGGRPVYPYQPDGIWESLAITKERDFSYPLSSDKDLYRRSLYTFWRRTVGPANMFDAASRQSCQVRTSITSTPLHALTTLNDPTWVEAARQLAIHALNHSPDLQGQMTFAFEQILCRPPKELELQQLTAAFEKQMAHFSGAPSDVERYLSVGDAETPCELQNEHTASLAAVCLLMFNLDEALTRE